MDLLGSRLGIEYDTHGMTGRIALQINEELSSFADIRDASPLVPELRAVKSAEEIAYVRKAAELGDKAYYAALDEIRPGADEGRILAAMQGTIFEGGGDYPGNEFIIGSGRDALLCRYKAGRRTLSDQDQITLEWAGSYRHYHAALMRTVVIGTPTDRHHEMYTAAREALAAVETQLVPGKTFGDVFDAHAERMDHHGMMPHRLNACGYSLGARFTPSWMDMPMAYKANPAEVKPNMVIFMHMILMDSITETAMTLGQTYLTTDRRSGELIHAAPRPAGQVRLNQVQLCGPACLLSVSRAASRRVTDRREPGLFMQNPSRSNLSLLSAPAGRPRPVRRPSWPVRQHRNRPASDRDHGARSPAFPVRWIRKTA